MALWQRRERARERERFRTKEKQCDLVTIKFMFAKMAGFLMHTHALATRLLTYFASCLRWCHCGNCFFGQSSLLSVGWEIKPGDTPHTLVHVSEFQPAGVLYM